jgi:hypothetical protein
MDFSIGHEDDKDESKRRKISLEDEDNTSNGNLTELCTLKKCEQWKGINCKQITRWQHLSWLKASAFFSLQKIFSCYETQQLILGTAIW